MKNTDKTDKQRENQEIIDNFDYLSNAVSAQDCTGLIPSEPQSDAERESYQDLYAYQYEPPKFPAENKSSKEQEK